MSMLRALYRGCWLRSFSSGGSLLPAIKNEVSDHEVETDSAKGVTDGSNVEPHLPEDETGSSKTEGDSSGKAADGSVHLHIRGKTDIRRVGGRLANVVRDLEKDEPVLIKATGTNAVNSAVKTIHMARRFLIERPGIHIGFSVNHLQDADKDRISNMQFQIHRIEPVTRDPNGLEEMWVKSRAKGRSVGGKMNLAMQNAENAISIAIGPRSVGCMIVGLTWARRLLRPRKLDAIAVPEMISVDLKDAEKTKKMTAIRLMLMRVPYERLPALDAEEPFDDNTDTSFIEDPMSK